MRVQCCSVRGFFNPATSFATDPKNRLASLMKTHKGQDKVLKTFADVIQPLALEIAIPLGASDKTITGIKKAGTGIKITRDVTGTFNLFRDTIPKSVGAIKDFRNLVNPSKDQEKPCEILKIASSACNVGCGLTSIWMGGAKPLISGKKYFGFDYGKVGNGIIVDAFPYVSCANHILSMGQHSFKIASLKDSDENYNDALTESILSLIEISAEIALDGLNLSRISAPAWISIPLRALSCGAGLVQVWQKDDK